MDLNNVSISLPLNTISICLSIICSGLVVARTVVKPLKKLLKLQEKQTNAIRCLLRKEIFEIVNRVDERNFIFQDEVVQLRKLFINYKDLEGNGIVDKMVERALGLPTKNREIKGE